ncbi:MAG: hypothetical protein ACREE0_10115, partial [Phenylobacterium sp.]
MKRSTGVVSSAGLSRTAAIVFVLVALAACSPAPKAGAPPAAEATAPAADAAAPPAADAAAPPPSTAAASETQADRPPDEVAADTAAPAPATGSSEMASTAPAPKIVRRPNIWMKSESYAANSHN